MIGVRTPGPIHLFARFRNSATGFYMGTCVAAPEPEAEKFKIPVMNDLSGRSVPFQLIQDGEIHMVMATMNRFDMFVIQNVRNVESGAPPTAASANPALGIETGFARGTLSIGVSDFELIFTNQYFNTAAQGPGITDLPAGRRYYSCNLRKYKESTVGTRVLEVAVAIECQNVFNPVSRGFSLYTEDPAAFGTLAPIV